MSQIGEAFVRVRALADTRSFEQETSRTLRSNRQIRRELEQTERQFGRFSRGALVGTGALHGLGRAAAFASVSFIGGAGLVYAIKSTIGAAEQAQVVLGQTEKAVQNAGLSWDQYGEHIERSTMALSNLSGFNDEALRVTFSNFIRKTHDVNRALYLNALAADVARGRNISLEAAQSLVIRASLGMAGALRRVGIAARQGASAVELITLLQKNYVGAAERYGETAAGAQERFRVAIENTQETIGLALLPTITRLLNQGTEWLNQEKNQEAIQQRVNSAVKIGTEVLHDLGVALGVARDAGEPLVEIVGGLKNAIELLIIAMAVGKVTRFATALGLIGPAAVTAGAGVATVEAEMAAGGAAAGVAAGRVSGLRSALLRLGALGAITVGIDLVLNHKAVDDWFNNTLPRFASFSGMDLIHSITGGGGSGSTQLGGIPDFGGTSALDRLTDYSISQQHDIGTPSPGSLKAESDRATSTATALAKAQAEGAKSQIIATANARLAYIRDTIAFAKKLEGKRGPTKELEATLQKFYGEEASTQGIIDQINEQAASDAESARNKAEAAARKAEAEAKRRAAERQRAYEALVRTRLVNLRTEVAATKNGTAAHKAAEVALTDALRDEIRDAKLSAEKRAGYHAALVNETNREAGERQKLLDARKKQADAERDRIKRLEEADQQNLQNAVARAQAIQDPEKSLRAERKADQAIVDAIKQRIREKHLTGLALANAQSELLTAERGLQDLERERIKRLEDTGEQNLRNAVARAQLIKDPDRELRAEKKADQAIIDAIKRRIREKHLVGLELANARGELLAAERSLQDLTKRKDDGFSLQDLFREAGSEFATYGSNIGPRGASLSPQDSRASLAQTVKTNQTIVVQHFNYPVAASQALNDAKNAAKNLR